MRLTKYSHACIRLERDGVLVIDPGGYSERVALDGVDAVLITHEHGDHLDLDALTEALARRPAVRIFTHPEVVAKLGDLSSVATEVNSGDDFTAAGFGVRVYGGWHALIHPDIPRVPNLGFVIDEAVYHPGDSFDIPADVQIDTLFVPISAPWLKAAESIDFIRAVKPRRAYALHDGIINELGAGLVKGLLPRMTGIDYERLTPGQSITV
jgi:L-ascorbate metabolism protein UlaG (beta-lactamase superfamily)